MAQESERRCTACGRIVPLQDRFCGGCGTPLSETPQPVPGARPPLHELFAHLRSGEQRPATVLMTDISGFTALGETAEPEWLFHLINQVFEELVECLLAHGAHIDKYVGDEIVALFGVPVAQERSTERAILSALAMRERLAALSRQGRFGDLVLDAHTGIHMGRVMVGPVGHRKHADYTVIGDTVNIAKRLEEEAPPGAIYVSDAVRDMVRGAFEFEPVGSIALRGRRQEIEVFQVLGARRDAGLQLLHARTEPHVAPREAERLKLAQRARAAAGGVQQIVCVVGPAGIGKSHLVADWCRSQDAQQFHVAAAACHACGVQFPFLALADLIAPLAGVRLEGWPPQAREDLAEVCSHLPIGDMAQRAQVALFRQLQEPPAQPEPDWLESLSDSFAALIAALARERPLCLILEDVQWIDEGTQSVLADVLTRYTRWPLLVVLSARTPVPEWIGVALQTTLVELRPLEEAHMRALIAAWTRPALLPDTTVRAVVDRAQGHPYFAHELVRTLRARPGQAFGDAPSLPDTLQELFLAQLDGLPLPLRSLVQSASVAGEPFSRSLLAATMGQEEPLTEELLWEGTRQGLIQVGTVPGHFTFGPRLLFDTAYVSIPPRQRQELHARIADHLTEEMAVTGTATLHAAAYHAYRGYRDARAVDLLVRSAEQYRAQYANRQAIQAASQALELISSVPEPAQLLSPRLRALLLLAQSYEVVGDIGGAEGALAEAELLAETCPDAELRAKIAMAAATLCWMRGQRADAEQRFVRAYEAWRSLSNATRSAHALVGVGLCASQRGERALRVFLQAASEKGIEPWVRAAALNNAGVILLEEGRYREAEPYLVEGLQSNEQDGDKRGVSQSKCSLGELLYRLADFDKARQFLGQAMREASEMEDTPCGQLAMAYLARTLCAMGQAEQARQLLVAAAPAGKDGHSEAEAVLRLALLEANCACALNQAQEQSEAAHMTPGAPSVWPPPAGACSVTVANVYVEALCVGLEASILAGDTAQQAAWLDALSQHIHRATDQHIRQYGQWLLEVEHRRTDLLPPGPVPRNQTQTVFDVRAQRLLDALAERPAAD